MPCRCGQPKEKESRQKNRMTLFAISVMNAHGWFRATLSHNIDNYLPVKRIRECYRRGQCGEGGDYPYAAHSPTASNPFAVTWPSPVSLRLSLREAYIVDLLAFNLNSSRITPPPALVLFGRSTRETRRSTCADPGVAFPSHWQARRLACRGRRSLFYRTALGIARHQPTLLWLSHYSFFP